MTGAGRPVVLAGADGSRAQVSPFGAHVTSWTTPDGREQLYLSAHAVLDGSAAIRGGIPVIFPQFAGEGALPKHGFARTTEWRMLPADAGEHSRGDAPAVDAQPSERIARVATFELTDSPATRAAWPHEFRALATVALRAGSLDVRLAVENRGSDLLSFTAALHTYLAMDDAFGAEIAGLAGLQYRDSITRVPGIQQAVILPVDGAVNRVYAGVPSRIEVREAGRAVVVETAGFSDAVIWNPGAEGEAALGDMAPGDARRMLCVEPAVVERPVALRPGARWEGVQRLTSR